MIVTSMVTGPVDSPLKAAESIDQYGLLNTLTYLNAVLITLTATAFFACLYEECKRIHKEWSVIARIFVPIYCTLNLIVYFSQISIVPQLLHRMNTSKDSTIYKIIFEQFLQASPGTVISTMNQLAYGMLGIPSIIFGWIMIKNKKISVFGGWMLLISGIACILGTAGTVMNNVLSNGSMIGGVFFLISLGAISLKKSR
jgi:hypothetical protein